MGRKLDLPAIWPPTPENNPWHLGQRIESSNRIAEMMEEIESNLNRTEARDGKAPRALEGPSHSRGRCGQVPRVRCGTFHTLPIASQCSPPTVEMQILPKEKISYASPRRHKDRCAIIEIYIYIIYMNFRMNFIIYWLVKFEMRRGAKFSYS